MKALLVAGLMSAFSPDAAAETAQGDCRSAAPSRSGATTVLETPTSSPDTACPGRARPDDAPQAAQAPADSRRRNGSRIPDAVLIGPRLLL